MCGPAVKDVFSPVGLMTGGVGGLLMGKYSRKMTRDMEAADAEVARQIAERKAEMEAIQAEREWNEETALSSRAMAIKAARSLLGLSVPGAPAKGVTQAQMAAVMARRKLGG